MPHTEVTQQTETLFEGKIVTLKRDIALLENGNQAVREVVCHNGGASVIAVTDQKEIYLVKQFRYPFMTELWEIPAGKLEKGENPFHAAKRELEEEVGITAKNYYDLGDCYPTVGYCNEKIFIYVATDLTKAQTNPDDDEFLTIEKVAFDKAVQMVMNGEIKDGKTVVAILKLDKLLQTGEIKI